MKLPASERLANALHIEGAPAALVNQARMGFFDDVKSPLTFPKIALFTELIEAGLHDFARRVIAGEFDNDQEDFFGA